MLKINSHAFYVVWWLADSVLSDLWRDVLRGLAYLWNWNHLGGLCCLGAVLAVSDGYIISGMEDVSIGVMSVHSLMKR